MSISSFNKLGGSAREILQVSLLLVAKITSGYCVRDAGEQPTPQALSLSSTGGHQDPLFSYRSNYFCGEQSGSVSHPLLALLACPCTGGSRGPACLPACRAATLGASARRARPQASWPQTRTLRGGKLRATTGEAMTRAQSTSPLQTPTPAPPPPPCRPYTVHGGGRRLGGGAGDEERGGASARRSPLRTHQAQGPPRSWALLLLGCEEWQAPPAG